MKTCRVVTFTSPKGGEGASTLACLAAGQMGRIQPSSVLFLEAHSPDLGDIDVLLNTQGDIPALSDLLSHQGSLSASLLRGFGISLSYGFDVLKIGHSEKMCPEFVSEALNALAGLYSVIIIDADHRNSNFEAIVEKSSRVILVVRPEPLTLGALRKFQSRMSAAQHPHDLFRIVPNRISSRAMWRNLLQDTVSISLLDVSLPDAVDDLDSTKEGRKFPVLSSKSVLGKQVSILCDALLADPGIQTKPKKAGLKNRMSRDHSAENRALRVKLYKLLVEDEDLALHSLGESRDLVVSRVRTAAEALVENQILEDFSRDDKKALVRELVEEATGLGPLEELLADPSITEIMVNGSNEIFIERAGKIENTRRAFVSEEQLRGIIERIVSPLGRRIDDSSPYVDARLPDGSRVHAIIPPLSLDGPCLTIRKFSGKRLGMNELVMGNSLSQDMADFLAAAVRAKMNVVVSGGTGSGKTTLLNILAANIGSEDRIVTIEDSAELQLHQNHVVRLESRQPNLEGQGAVTIRDLVRNALRMRPDRIIVGECRGGEALDMLQAMNTGHDGSLTTGHANTPRDMLARLETMVLMSGVELPLRAVREQISSAVNLIVHTQRMRDGSRKVVSITEVLGMEGDVITTQPLFQFVQESFQQDKVLGRFEPTGIIPGFLEELKSKGVSLNPAIFQS